MLSISIISIIAESNSRLADILMGNDKKVIISRHQCPNTDIRSFFFFK